MFQNCASFERATEMFYSMQYEEGLNIINECIEKDSRNSILYSNRALFFSQLGYIEEALSDLNFAIELNYLNYIAYFNMFSLLMRIQKLEEAFQNLCCSLSCLYLIRGKTKKSELDASKAIKYAQNNIEAHILKGLIHLQNGKYKLALNQLDWACEINPQHEIVKNIRNMIFRKMNPGLQIDESQFERNNEQYQHKNQFVRLQSSYTFEEDDRESELRDRIIEFNEIYNNLNEFQGTVTTKVPKEEENPYQQNQPYIENDIQCLNQNSQIDAQIQPIEKDQQQNRGNVISKRESTQKKEEIRMEIAPNCTEQTNTTLTDDSMMNNDHQNLKTLAQQVALKLKAQAESINDDMAIQNQHEQPKQSFERVQREKIMPLNDSQAIIADNGVATPSSASMAPEPGQYGNPSENQYFQNQINLSQNSKSFQSIKDKQNEKQLDRFSEFQSMIYSHNSGNAQHQSDQKAFEEDFESIITQNNQNENQETSLISNALYPRPENALIQFSILKLEIQNMSKEQIEEMKNLYCIANYLNVKERTNHSNFKLRTACQKGFNNGTEWNETFDPIEIPQNPECMKIKVYNKKYSSYRDDLIGEMEVEITTHGLVKLPLFNKKGELSGSIFLNLELVFPEIHEADESDEV